MKMSRLISMALLGVALVATPVYAQRGGGGGGRGGSGGGGSVSHSSGGSRGGGGFSGGSRGSSSYSGGSHSSSSSSSFSRSSSSSSSRSSSSYSSSRGSSYSAPSHSSTSSSSYSGDRSVRYSGNSGLRSSNYDGRGGAAGRGNNVTNRTGSVPDQVRSRAMRSSEPSRSGAVMGRGDNGRGPAGRGVVRTDNPGASRVGNGRPNGTVPNPGYATPGNPNRPMPPSHHHMHPAPYFYHPHHHCMVHCHPLFWDPFPPRPFYWPGFWYYCNSYWYDYHVNDIVVVRQYVKDTYSMNLITYAMSADFMYCLVDDPDGHTYFQVYDKNDKLLAEQQVSRKYCKMEIDQQNGGCWIMKKKDKDALLFLYTPEDGKLLIYEADK